jgi:putative ABC transport system ATP-binding protein
MIKHLNKFDLLREVRSIFFKLIGNDKKFLWIAIFYGMGISLLTLAVPVCVQLLMNSVAYIASVEAVILLSLLLLFLLLCSGCLTVMQSYILELFERRIYTKLTSEITLRNLLADYQYSIDTNKSDLVNRYFDIMNMQKTIPNLIVGLFAFFLQTCVGILVVSSYHPFLLLFNVFFLSLVWLIWRIWGYDALLASVNVSDAKYQTVNHIETVARHYDYFSSHVHTEFAVQKTDNLISQYLKYRQKYFKFNYAQQVSFLILYAFSSSGLLGVGGLLVIGEELTLGQLVASELILSAIFYGIVKLSYSLTAIYDLGAAVEEIYRVYQIPTENNSGLLSPPLELTDLIFHKAEFADINNESNIYLDFTIKAGQKIVALCSTHKIQQIILQSVVRHLDLKSGRILLGDYDIRDINPRQLRDSIIILRKLSVFETTIREYLTLNRTDILSSDIYDALELMDLHFVVDKLEQGLDTHLSTSGFPLSPSELLRLKLAAALLLKPKIIILTQLFDTIPSNMNKMIMKRLRGLQELTIIYFSNHLYDTDDSEDIFDEYLYIDEVK